MKDEIKSRPIIKSYLQFEESITYTMAFFSILRIFYGSNVIPRILSEPFTVLNFSLKGIMEKFFGRRKASYEIVEGFEPGS